LNEKSAFEVKKNVDADQVIHESLDDSSTPEKDLTFMKSQKN
jgi:hypothetical protein